MSTNHQTELWEDNAGGLVLAAWDQGKVKAWDVTAAADGGYGNEDLFAAHDGNTESWTVPVVGWSWGDAGTCVAVIRPNRHDESEDEFVIFPERCGSAARTYLGIPDRP